LLRRRFRELISIAVKRILAVPEWEQNHFSGESKLVLRATQQHQIVLFFFRILCVGQDVQRPRKIARVDSMFATQAS
jgi:hypothetical protein